VHAERELFLGHRLERAEVRFPGRADEGVEAPDLFVHGSHGVRRADVNLNGTRGPPGHDDVMSSRQELDYCPADGACATNRDDAHERSL
jgi:hypothetical protein